MAAQRIMAPVAVLSTLPIVVGVAVPIGVAGYLVRMRLERNRQSLTEKLTGLHFSNSEISAILRLIPAKQRYQALLAILASREKQIDRALDEVEVAPLAPGGPDAPAPLGEVQRLLGAIERDERLSAVGKKVALGAPFCLILLFSTLELTHPRDDAAPPIAKTSAPDAAVVATAPRPEPEPAPPDYATLVASAAERVAAGDCAGALPLFEGARALRPDGLEALNGLGHCYLVGKDYARAQASFTAALAHAPRDDEALIGLGDAYRLDGQRQRARVAYDRYLALHPRGPGAAKARRAADAVRRPHVDADEKAVDLGF
jgi:tetratricopeptide (TPR) repeat protein